MLYLPTVLPANSKSLQTLWNTSRRWKGFGVQHRKRTTAPSLLQHPRSDIESTDEKCCTEATLSFFPVQLISFSWGWLSTGTSCPAREAVQCPSLELYKKAIWTRSWAACLSRGAGAASLQRYLPASAVIDSGRLRPEGTPDAGYPTPADCHRCLASVSFKWLAQSSFLEQTVAGIFQRGFQSLDWC